VDPTFLPELTKTPKLPKLVNTTEHKMLITETHKDVPTKAGGDMSEHIGILRKKKPS
jgi:hypothetical protein